MRGGGDGVVVSRFDVGDGRRLRVVCCPLRVGHRPPESFRGPLLVLLTYRLLRLTPTAGCGSFSRAGLISHVPANAAAG